MDATTTQSIFTTFVGDIGTLLATNLPTVFVIVGALLGLSILVRYVKRHVK